MRPRPPGCRGRACRAGRDILRSLLIGRLVGGIDADQRVADIGDIDFHIGDILPGVRIVAPMPALAMTMLMLMPGERLHSLGGDEPRAAIAGGFHQPVGPAFQTKSVDHHELRSGELA